MEEVDKRDNQSNLTAKNSFGPKEENLPHLKAEEDSHDDTFLRQWVEVEDLKEDFLKTDDGELIKNEETLEEDQCNSNKERSKGHHDEDMRGKNGKLHYMKVQSCKIAKLAEELCKNAPVTEKAASFCRFKCPKCQREFQSWGHIRKHYCAMDQVHPTKISLVNFAQSITKTICHICKICSTPLLCDGIFINRHLRAKHQMRLRKYVRLYGIDSSKTVAEGSYSDNVIGNLCLYKCQDCQEQFNTWRNLDQHQKAKSHSTGRTSYRERYNVMTTKVYHKCRLCFKTFLCERHNLQLHFKIAHKVSFSDYCTKTGCVIKDSEKGALLKTLKVSTEFRNLCVFECNVCKNRFHNMKSFGYHRETCDDLSEYKSYMACLVEGFSYKCKMCSRLMLCDRYNIYNHMRSQHGKLSSHTFHKDMHQQYEKVCDSFKKDIPLSKIVHSQLNVPISNFRPTEITSTIGNLCTFSCPSCISKTFSSWRALEYHLEKVHNKTLTYSPSLVVSARYHSCLMCPMATLSDRKLLKRHLKNTHKMKLSKYEAIFIKYGGKTLPPFRIWAKSASCSL